MCFQPWCSLQNQDGGKLTAVAVQIGPPVALGFQYETQSNAYGTEQLQKA